MRDCHKVTVYKIIGEVKSGRLSITEGTDQILSLLETQMLTQVEARALVQVFAGKYGKIDIMNEESPLCLKLKRIAEEV